MAISPPVIDRRFKTIDYLVIFDVTALSLSPSPERWMRLGLWQAPPSPGSRLIGSRWLGRY